MVSAFQAKVQFVPDPSLGDPSLVLMRFDRTYSLHQTAPWMEPVRLQDVIGRVESGTETESDAGTLTRM